MAASGSATEHGRHVFAGIAFMCLGAMCMVGLDVTVRFLLERYPLTQAIALRSVFSFGLLFAVIWQRGQLRKLRTNRPGWHVFRSVLMTGSMFAFFFALKFIALTDVIVLAFAAPLIVTALSRPFLGEPVGPWRWLAVIAGFAGVVVVVRPGYGVMHPASFVALGGAALYAGLALTARKLSDTESPWALSWYSFIAPVLIAGGLALANWTPPTVTGWLLFALAGAFGGFAFLLINAAYGRAPAAIIVPFEYTGLLWATGAGYVFWREVPTFNTWLGAAIIVGSGIFILFRETVVRPVADPGLDFPLQEAVGRERDRV